MIIGIYVIIVISSPLSLNELRSYGKVRYSSLAALFYIL